MTRSEPSIGCLVTRVFGLAVTPSCLINERGSAYEAPKEVGDLDFAISVRKLLESLRQCSNIMFTTVCFSLVSLYLNNIGQKKEDLPQNNMLI